MHAGALRLVMNKGAFTAVPQGTESTRHNIHKGRVRHCSLSVGVCLISQEVHGWLMSVLEISESSRDWGLMHFYRLLSVD